MASRAWEHAGGGGAVTAGAGDKKARALRFCWFDRSTDRNRGVPRTWAGSPCYGMPRKVGGRLISAGANGEFQPNEANKGSIYSVCVKIDTKHHQSVDVCGRFGTNIPRIGTILTCLWTGVCVLGRGRQASAGGEAWRIGAECGVSGHFRSFFERYG